MTQRIDRPLKIFILDDEKDICFFFKEFLVRRGFDVVTALTGVAAVKVLKKEKPDIAILDIYLCKGKMNGIDVLKFIKEEQSNCCCLMVSRADDEKIVNQTKELGAEDYLLKPLMLEKIEKKINKIVLKIKKGRK